MKTSYKNVITVSLLFIGAVFIAIGVYRGENLEILRKAINICLECIGLG